MLPNPYMNPFINQFPYMDSHEMNLDWIIKTCKMIIDKMNGFEAANTVEYKGEWSITTQYTKWSIVMDTASGYLMIAKQPVPVGIDITNSDYWMVVSPFKIDQALLVTSNNAISNKAVTTKFNQVDDAIDAEIAARQNADTAINGRLDTTNINLSNESADRAAADLALSSRIDTTDTNLANEITTRTNDVNRLNTRVSNLNLDIANEVTARAAADDVLSARIDNIVALTPGSTTGDAELQDIRVGANGVTYDTAGDAVRDQIDALQDELATIGYSTELTPVKVDNLNFVENGTAFQTSSSHETYYIPVIAGRQYKWISGKIASTPALRFVYSTQIPANAVSGTYIEQKTITGDNVTFTYDAENNGYICIAVYKDNVNVTVMEVTQYSEGELSEINEEITRLDKLTAKHEDSLDYLGYVINRTPTLVDNLNFVQNGTAFVSGSAYETYYIPVTQGEKYRWTSGKITGTPFLRFVFSTQIPANTVPGTYLEQLPLTNDTATFEYNAAADGYLCMAVYEGQVNTSLMNVEQYLNGEVNSLINITNVLRKNIDSLNNPVTYHEYTGEHIELDKKILRAKHVISLTDTIGVFPLSSTWNGGLAIYKNLAFSYYNNGYVAVFDLDTKDIIATGRTAVYGSNNHANNAAFDYDTIVGDYPIVYISRCKNIGTECYVESISIDTDTKALTETLIQTITYSGNLWNGTETVDWAFDNKNRHLVMLTDGNIAIFNVPDLSSETVELTDADIIARATYPTDYVRQGSSVYLDKLYLLTGFATQGELRVINLNNSEVLSSFDLTSITTEEPEGICVTNNNIYLGFNNEGHGISLELYEVKPY